MKRVFDLAITIPATILATPLLLIVGALVLLTSGWPVVIVQDRVGANETTFRMFKFRTMKRDTPVVAKSLLDPKSNPYTPLGRVLRRWSFDELPQLINVLLGSMSLVGPRPALPSQTDLIDMRRRASVTALKPGLTGFAQVKGRESLTLSSKVRLERLYARRQSLTLDARLVVATIKALSSKKGVF